MVEVEAGSDVDGPLSVGRVVQVNVSPGGVPKLPVPGAWVGRAGVEGDAQAHPDVHGGPHRAVALLCHRGHPAGRR